MLEKLFAVLQEVNNTILLNLYGHSMKFDNTGSMNLSMVMYKLLPFVYGSIQVACT